MNRVLLASLSLVIGILPLMVAPAAQAQNLIVNGSFETPVLTGSYNLFSTIDGWTGVGADIEIGKATTYGVTGIDGNQVCELDSTKNYTVEQSVTSLVAGSYDLSFLSALRNNVAATSGSFDVLWNGSVVASYSPTSTTMKAATLAVTAATGTNTVGFRGTGTSDSYGALLDRVSLVRSPEPGTFALAALALPLLGVLRPRRLR